MALFYLSSSVTSLNAAGTRAVSLEISRSYCEWSEDDLLLACVLTLRYGEYIFNSWLPGPGVSKIT